MQWKQPLNYFSFISHLFICLFIYTSVCVSVCVCRRVCLGGWVGGRVYVCTAVCVWKLEDKLWGLFLSFYHVDSKNGTQVFRLGGKHPYLVSCFVCQVEVVCVHNVCKGELISQILMTQSCNPFYT